MILITMKQPLQSGKRRSVITQPKPRRCAQERQVYRTVLTLCVGLWMKIAHSKWHIFLAWRNAVDLGTFQFRKILILASPPLTPKTTMTWMAISKETPRSCSETSTKTAYGEGSEKTAERPHQAILRSGSI